MNGISVIDSLCLFTILLPAVLRIIAILIRDARLRRASDHLERQIERLRKEVANQAPFTRMLAHEIRTVAFSFPRSSITAINLGKAQ
jgi:hypothetical protein